MSQTIVLMLARIGLFLILIAVGAGSLIGYRAYARHRDLQETLAWMERTYNPHEGGENFGLGHGTETHYIDRVEERTTEVTEQFKQTLVLKGGCTVSLLYETVPIGVFKNLHSKGQYTINLCDDQR
jgi:hypothetical protein